MSSLTKITRDSIIAHRQGGLTIPISRKSGGVVVDISARTLTFKTKSGLNIPLTADPNNATGKLLTITAANLQTLAAGQVTEFALVDETADPDEVLWAGNLQVAGF